VGGGRLDAMGGGPFHTAIVVAADNDGLLR